jgi:hypothetical protein
VAVLALWWDGGEVVRAQEAKRLGSIKGTVRLTGDPPQLPGLPVPRDELACGEEVPDDALVVGKGGALQGAVVFVDGLLPGKEPTGRKSALVEANRCRLQPRVVSLTVGDELVLGTVDPVFHNLRGLHLGADGAGTPRGLFNQGFPPGGQRARVKVRESGFTLVRGELNHPWMRGVVRVFNHPYHVVTGGDGTFEIPNVPAGTHVLRVWHERLGARQVEVTVPAGYPARVDLELPASGLRLAPWDVVKRGGADGVVED